MKPFPANPQKILIRSTNWIGDAVMSTPAVRAIRENFPQSEITILAKPWVADVFRYSPMIDHLLIYDKKERHRGFFGMLRLARELQSLNFDCAILLQNAFEAALIATMARIPVRGGYNTDGRGLLLSHKVQRQKKLQTSSAEQHEVYYYLRIVRGLGLRADISDPELFLPEKAIEAASGRIQNLNGKQDEKRPLVGLSPGAAFGPAKRWPAEQFAKLVSALHRQTGANMLLFGGTADHATAEAIIAGADPLTRKFMHNLAGKTSLIEAMALIKACAVFITNDSGLMHVAAALRRPVVAIFGSTDHIATGPWSDRAAIVRVPLPCSPCKKSICPEKHFHCMNMIDKDDVLAAVLSQLQQHKKTSAC